MGTKANPDRFDCYERAEPNEPLFTLLGRDPQGADMVHLWAALRAKDAWGARRVFDRMQNRAAEQPRKAGDPDKICAAVNCAVAMADWRKAHRP